MEKVDPENTPENVENSEGEDYSHNPEDANAKDSNGEPLSKAELRRRRKEEEWQKKKDVRKERKKAHKEANRDAAQQKTKVKELSAYQAIGNETKKAVLKETGEIVEMKISKKEKKQVGT
jgi:hypothetical protein